MALNPSFGALNNVLNALDRSPRTTLWVICLFHGSISCAQGFSSEATIWPTPAGGVSGLGGASGYMMTECSIGYMGSEVWTTVDMDGDSRPDLVITAEVDETNGTQQFGAEGDPHWLVHLNNGSGFDAEPLLWTTPTGGAPGYFAPLGYNRVMSDAFDMTSVLEGSQRWNLRDMDGDSRPDLVVMSAYESDLTYPRQLRSGDMPVWKVFWNNGAGFNAEPTLWSTPDGGMINSDSVDLGFPAFQNDQVGVGNGTAIGNDRWKLVDMTGDQRPDLVVTSERSAGPSPVVYDQLHVNGSPMWAVHVNTGSGFDSEPLIWSTPEGGLLDANAGFGFNSTQGGSEVVGSQTWAIVDMQGDRRPDLVTFSLVDVNGSTSQYGYGVSPFWNVYLNNGVGFADEPTYWLTPTGGYSNEDASGYTFLRNDDTFIPEEVWSLADLDGDGAPELIAHGYGQTAAPDPGQFELGGVPAWKVFDNLFTSFSSAVTRWTTPAGGMVNSNGEAFGFLGTEHYGSLLFPENEAWSTMDINGDLVLDLVVTSSGGIQFGAGTDPHWLVFFGSGLVNVDDRVGSEGEFALYPNPCDAECWITTAHDVQRTEFLLSDALGRVRVNFAVHGFAVLDVSLLEPGIYTITPKARTGHAARFVVE